MKTCSTRSVIGREFLAERFVMLFLLNYNFSCPSFSRIWRLLTLLLACRHLQWLLCRCNTFILQGFRRQPFLVLLLKWGFLKQILMGLLCCFLDSLTEWRDFSRQNLRRIPNTHLIQRWMISIYHLKLLNQSLAAHVLLELIQYRQKVKSLKLMLMWYVIIQFYYEFTMVKISKEHADRVLSELFGQRVKIF